MNLFIAVATLCTTLWKWLFLYNPRAHNRRFFPVSCTFGLPFVLPHLSPSIWLRATATGILHFDESSFDETKEQADLRYAKQSSILGLFVLLNMVAPYCHRFCTVHRCEIGAVRMPRNCCHRNSERCNRSIRLRMFLLPLFFIVSPLCALYCGYRCRFAFCNRFVFLRRINFEKKKKKLETVFRKCDEYINLDFYNKIELNF